MYVNSYKQLLIIFCLFATDSSIAVTQEFGCFIEPWKSVEISFPGNGILDAINVEQSQVIKKGQLLAQLDSGLEKANVNLRAAKAAMQDEIKGLTATLAFTQRMSKRLEKLYHKNSIPFSSYDEAKTEVLVTEQRLQTAKNNQRLAKLELKVSQQRLKRRSVKSPIDAVVMDIHKSVGEYIEDEPVLSLAQMNPLRVQVLLPLTFFGKIEKGMHGAIRAEAPMDAKVYVATVVIVDSGVDIASGTFAVQLKLDNSEAKLASGLKCSIKFSP
ncbi:MAG: efflux RND transporter periplasmic adaptor subunit [Pseudomonadales bacterium]|nr:efflux RND transporter periplasmic adaptor subunit [Pseudomonadales bacterium]